MLFGVGRLFSWDSFYSSETPKSLRFLNFIAMCLNAFCAYYFVLATVAQEDLKLLWIWGFFVSMLSSYNTAAKTTPTPLAKLFTKERPYNILFHVTFFFAFLFGAFIIAFEHVVMFYITKPEDVFNVWNFVGAIVSIRTYCFTINLGIFYKEYLDVLLCKEEPSPKAAQMVETA